MWRRYTPPIPGPDSIAFLESVSIGGVDQWLLIRGENRSNPIVLFLHGGPGSAQIAMARKYTQELERDFVVVNWDQRGSGLSFSPAQPKESLHIEQFIQDTVELTRLLLQRFGQSKLFVVGHSWGTVLGVLTAARHPELFHAYVGMGQVVNMVDNEAVSYRFVLEEARRRNNPRAVRELERIGAPPYPNMKALMVQRNWLARFGGSIRKGTVMGFALRSLLFSTEYVWCDAVRWIRGNMRSVEATWDELMRVDLPRQVPSLAVPVYFVEGRYDYQVPSELAVAYLDRLEAPRKELIWLENSAHLLIFEEPERFAAVMRQVLADQRLGR